MLLVVNIINNVLLEFLNIHGTPLEHIAWSLKSPFRKKCVALRAGNRAVQAISSKREITTTPLQWSRSPDMTWVQTFSYEGFWEPCVSEAYQDYSRAQASHSWPFCSDRWVSTKTLARQLPEAFTKMHWCERRPSSRCIGLVLIYSSYDDCFPITHLVLVALVSGSCWNLFIGYSTLLLSFLLLSVSIVIIGTLLKYRPNIVVG